MAATALQLAKDAAAIIGVEEPAALKNSTDPGARAMLVHLNTVGRGLAVMVNAFSQGWSVLQREYEFDTVAGQDEYPFPEDFARLVDGTVWDRTQYTRARGNLTAQEWALVKGGLIETLTISPLYRLRRSSAGTGRAFYIDPTPSAVENLALEYVSSHWVRGVADDAFRDRFVEDTDEPLLDEELFHLGLIWNFKESRGLPFAADLAKFEERRDILFGQDTGERVLTIGRSRRRPFYPYNIAETGFGGISR